MGALSVATDPVRGRFRRENVLVRFAKGPALLPINMVISGGEATVSNTCLIALSCAVEASELHVHVSKFVPHLSVARPPHDSLLRCTKYRNNTSNNTANVATAVHTCQNCYGSLFLLFDTTTRPTSTP